MTNPPCPRCRSTHGTFFVTEARQAGGQRWECVDCDRRFFVAHSGQ